MIRILTALGLTNLADDEVSAFEELAPARQGALQGRAAVVVSVLAALMGAAVTLEVRQLGLPVTQADSPPVPRDTAARLPSGSDTASDLMVAAPVGPTPEELQEQIEAIIAERSRAMRASLEQEFDDKVAQMQRELEAASEAARQALEAQATSAPADAARAAEAAPGTVPPPEPRFETPAPPRPAGPPDSASGAAVASSEAAPQQPEVRRGELVSPGPGVVPPSLLRRSPPIFPALAANLEREATVEVRVLVSETGEVLNAVVVGEAQGFGFDQAALDAARRTLFAPATKSGVPVAMWTKLRFVFRPGAGSPPPS